MDPWRLIAILEHSDPTFKKLLFPDRLHCRLGDRVVRAIEEHWPVYFPTRKQCRGASWTLSISENDPLYKPRRSSLHELDEWKAKVKGTIAEGRGYRADRSWKRFAAVCRKSSTLRPILNDFKPLVNFLIEEESLWPRYSGMAVGMEEYFQAQLKVLLSTESPYRFAAPERLRFVGAKKATFLKVEMIHRMRHLFDRPLMILALLQKCAEESKEFAHWLGLQDYVARIVKAPSATSIRVAWLEHAMRASDSIKKSGRPCPRKWARRLLAGVAADPNDIEDDAITTKAIEVNNWLKSNKQPSVENIKRSWLAVVAAKKLDQEQSEAGEGRWLLSWMVALLFQKHFTEVAAEFKGQRRHIRHYYRRFFHYLDLFSASIQPGGWRA